MGGGVGAGVGGVRDSGRGTFGGIGSWREDWGGGLARSDSGCLGGSEGGDDTLSSVVILIIRTVEWDELPLRYQRIFPL